ncbi:hypothetical protein COO91_02466 [Nostoc flagelliforme CCNUN1]|uniref:Uncharacterized protein n=1 Tax=Nostoc flagelliforme CCNUN1 TaxID=2038116 RepID=A0A2K8SM89_9NOSO|nr:hypothetical protein COO91_02466 [Nostoc flagelliforme CCNUN1]
MPLLWLTMPLFRLTMALFRLTMPLHQPAKINSRIILVR